MQALEYIYEGLGSPHSNAKDRMVSKRSERDAFDGVRRGVLHCYAFVDAQPETETVLLFAFCSSQRAQQDGNKLTFGEVLPAGVTKIMDKDHLDASNAKVMIDLVSQSCESNSFVIHND